MALNRITPQGRPGNYITYAVRRKPDVLVKTSCEVVGCPDYLRGWKTTIDESTPLGRQQANYIRKTSGRTFKEHKSGGLTVFIFDSKQRCFGDHRTIAETFSVLNGDWRRYGGTIRQHANGRDWAEDFGEHQQRVADQIERG
jgi:hypothetical protein